MGRSLLSRNSRRKKEFFKKSAKNFRQDSDEGNLPPAMVEDYLMTLDTPQTRLLPSRYWRGHMFSPRIQTLLRDYSFRKQLTPSRAYPMTRLQPTSQWRIFSTTGRRLMRELHRPSVVFILAITKPQLLTMIAPLSTQRNCQHAPRVDYLCQDGELVSRSYWKR